MLPSNAMKYLSRSIYKHFEDYKGAYPLGLEDQVKVNADDSYILRYDGPISDSIASGLETFVISVNLLVTCKPNPANVYKLEEMIDAMRPAFTCFYLVNDLDTQLCLLQRLDEIEVKKFNNLKASQFFATIEAQFTGTI